MGTLNGGTPSPYSTGGMMGAPTGIMVPPGGAVAPPGVMPPPGAPPPATQPGLLGTFENNPYLKQLKSKMGGAQNMPPPATGTPPPSVPTASSPFYSPQTPAQNAQLLQQLINQSRQGPSLATGAASPGVTIR